MARRVAEWRRRIGGAGGAPQTFDAQVLISANDADQYTDDSVNLAFSSIFTDATTEHAAARWPNVTIPGGATIDVAHVGMYMETTGRDEPKHQIRGESADTGVFTTASNNIDARARTSASVQWNSTDLGAADIEFWEWGASSAGLGNGANLNTIVQEIVDDGSWASGNGMVMIWEQHTSSQSNRDLGCYASDFSTPNKGPKIHVEYTA